MVGLLAKADPALRRGREEVGHRFLLLRRGARAKK